MRTFGPTRTATAGRNWRPGPCLSGPHKDDLAAWIDGQPARQFASQGQTRTAALSLKLAERELFEDDTGQWPVLLLDDVLSELDARGGRTLSWTDHWGTGVHHQL